MPKNRTHSGAKKCFRVTGSDKIMCEQAGARHLLGYKFSRRIRRLITDQVSENADVKRVKRLLSKRPVRIRELKHGTY